MEPAYNGVLIRANLILLLTIAAAASAQKFEV